MAKDQDAPIKLDENPNDPRTRIRKLNRIITGWQQHIDRMAKILGCFGIQDEVEEAAQKLKADHARLQQEVERLSTRNARDYVEDFDSSDDNGFYSHECWKCKNEFAGHKRRLSLCKKCHLKSLEEVMVQLNTGTHSLNIQVERLTKALEHYADERRWSAAMLEPGRWTIAKVQLHGGDNGYDLARQVLDDKERKDV